MFNRILISTDGSPGTERVVDRIIDLARTFDAEVHVLSVVDIRAFAGVELAEEEALERATIEAGRRAVTAVRDRVDMAGRSTTQAIRTGIPHAEILTYVDEHDVDLVVMGTNARTGVELAALGSTTERVFRGANIPVFTLHLDGDTGDSGAGYDDVLVPTDGSAAADRAGERAIAFADRHGATVHALYVVDTSIFDIQDAPRSVLGPLREGGQNAVAALETMAMDAGVPATTSVAEGTPHEQILANAGDADLIVMGRRGRTGLPDVLLGSVTAKVVRLAAPPVLSVT